MYSKILLGSAKVKLRQSFGRVHTPSSAPLAAETTSRDGTGGVRIRRSPTPALAATAR